jgi:predicted RNase H-like HicB family nuclease
MPKKQASKPIASTRRALVFTVEFDREKDGRWIADIPDLPGVMVYGESKEDALVKVQALAYRVLADKIEQERAPQPEVRFASA